MNHFVFKGNRYDFVLVDDRRIADKIVCVDSIFYNVNKTKLGERYLAPPTGCRSAFQRIKFQDMITKKDLLEANKYFDKLLEKSNGFLIPNIDHRWFVRIAEMMDNSKLVYTTKEFEPGVAYIVVRHAAY